MYKSPSVEIKDLQLIFIELPKFKAKNYQGKKLQVLWLRFMSELNEKVNQVPADWLEVPEIKQAIDLAEEAAYTPTELEDYDRYWDAISIEKTLVGDALRRGQAEGRAEGVLETQQVLARKLVAKDMTVEEIATLMDLSAAEIKTLLN